MAIFKHLPFTKDCFILHIVINIFSQLRLSHDLLCLNCLRQTNLFLYMLSSEHVQYITINKQLIFYIYSKKIEKNSHRLNYYKLQKRAVIKRTVHVNNVCTTLPGFTFVFVYSNRTICVL
jgi:hypothetical protein